MSLRASVVALAVALLACSSPKQEAYQRLAAKLNPVIEQMRATAEAMQRTPPTDLAAVIRTCTSADDALWILREIEEAHFNEHTDTNAHRFTLVEQARALLDYRATVCRSPHTRSSCARNCLKWWAGIVDEVERLRAGAHAHGITIPSLKLARPAP